MVKRLWLAVAWVPLTLVGCPSFFKACTTEARAGINLEIRDAVTQQPAALGATITLTDGAYSEPLSNLDGLGAAGAFERAGTYSVRVAKQGYKTFQKDGVVVTKDECHVIPVKVTALLEPQSP